MERITCWVSQRSTQPTKIPTLPIELSPVGWVEQSETQHLAGWQVPCRLMRLLGFATLYPTYELNFFINILRDMDILDKGHKYRLSDNKSETNSNTLTFYKDASINLMGYEGTTNQEVIRALIDRVQFLDAQIHHQFNDRIIKHLRMALVLHEMRHLERLVDHGTAVEKIPALNGHFV